MLPPNGKTRRGGAALGTTARQPGFDPWGRVGAEPEGAEGQRAPPARRVPAGKSPRANPPAAVER